MRATKQPIRRLFGALARLFLAGLSAYVGGGDADAAAAAKPQRIVSLNLCTDQILFDLVGRDRVRALSHLAADPMLSPIAAEIAGIRTTRGEAEDVLRLAPDLVVASTWSAAATVALLQRLGMNVSRVPQPETVADIRQVIVQLAGAVGESERGDAMIATFDARLAAATARLPPGAARPTALLYQVGGIVAGAGSLADVAIRLAGFDNLAVLRGLGPTDTLPLETLVARPPDLLVLGHSPGDFRTAAADNLAHPALKWLLSRRPVLELPQRLWLCGTQRWVESVERLVAARGAFEQPTATERRR